MSKIFRCSFFYYIDNFYYNNPKCNGIEGLPSRRSLNVFYSIQRNKALLRGNVMVTDGSEFAVRTDQEFDIVHSMRESNVLECEHVSDCPKVLQRLGVRCCTFCRRKGQVELERGWGLNTN